MKKKMFSVGMRTIHRLQAPYYQGAAAEIGFYFLFSIIPIFTLLFQVINRLSVARQVYLQLVDSLKENELILNLLTSLQNVHTGSINIVFILIALWSASKIEFSMIRIANNTYQCKGESGIVGYFRARARAVVTIFLLITIIMVSLLILVYGNYMIDLFNQTLGDTLHIRIDFLTSFLRWPLTLLIYWFFLAINYTMLPNEKVPLKQCIPGSLFAAVGILVSTFAYYIYFEYFSHLNLVYGSLATLIALLLWFYWLGFILVVGMVVNVSWFSEEEA